MSPRIERQIERVLILGGKPVMRRPIAAATVLEALPFACRVDRAVCEEVRNYLQSYMRTFGVSTLRAGATATNGDSGSILPNQRGEAVDSPWRVDAKRVLPAERLHSRKAGGVAYDGEAFATGSFLSLGFDFAQLDVGFREHWFSPLSDSSSLISTEAPTMPSITLSNYDPISPLGISYEVFMAEMSEQSGILVNGGYTTGKPRLGGFQFVLEPVTGYAVGINRVVQYGGGAREGADSRISSTQFSIRTMCSRTPKERRTESQR